ncbi:MAG: hypothetical protein WAM14_02650 [Candidatus Nitrosopolaris sp.]
MTKRCTNTSVSDLTDILTKRGKYIDTIIDSENAVKLKAYTH